LKKHKIPKKRREKTEIIKGKGKGSNYRNS